MPPKLAEVVSPGTIAQVNLITGTKIPKEFIITPSFHESYSVSTDNEGNVKVERQNREYGGINN